MPAGSLALYRRHSRSCPHQAKGVDLGQLLKPFVFLDHFDLRGAAGGTELHPHSGIATVTYLFEGSLRYEDSNGTKGIVLAGGVEWFKAAHGAWHAGGPGDSGRARGFQLWLALPADHELGPVENIYVPPESVAGDGPARVLVGVHAGAASPLNGGASVSYLAVRLAAGESWRFRPAADHAVGWLALSTGRVRIPEAVEGGELVILDPSNETVDVVADAAAEFVIGSAVPHPHELALGSHSVHTSPATLRAGESRLKKIQRRLQSERRL